MGIMSRSNNKGRFGSNTEGSMRREEYQHEEMLKEEQQEVTFLEEQVVILWEEQHDRWWEMLGDEKRENTCGGLKVKGAGIMVDEKEEEYINDKKEGEQKSRSRCLERSNKRSRT